METNKIYKALLARCEADRMEALATLDVYITNPTGIGEHPQIVSEAMTALDNLTRAKGKLTELKQQYGNHTTSSQIKEDLDLESLARKMDDFLKIVTEGK
jgi:hypothetical protein